MRRRAITHRVVIARFLIVGLGGLLTALDGNPNSAAALVAALTATYLVVRLLEAPGAHSLFADIVLSTSALAVATEAYSLAFAAVPLVPLWALARRSPRWGYLGGAWYIAILWVETQLIWAGEGREYIGLLTLLALAIMISSHRLSKTLVGPDAAAYSLVTQVRELTESLERDPARVGMELLLSLQSLTGIDRIALEGPHGRLIASIGGSWEIDQATGRLPVQIPGRTIAVVVSPERIAVTSPIEDLLQERAIALGTAIAFADIRSMASDAERSRLAREMHDGIAQEVASLGYAIDDLMSQAPIDMRAQLRELRNELTRIVSDLRLSIFELRVRDEGVGLGSALSELVERVQEAAPFEIRLRLDESHARFPRSTEDQLLRITQEALANAKRHSRAHHVWITANLHPPHAEITIEDDGVGLSRGREDSFGLQVMHERATEINGALTVRDRLGGGTVVSLVLDPEQIPSRATSG